MTILCRKTSPKCKLCFQCFLGGKCMKIMLVMTNYAKKYASTIYQSLVSSTPPPFSLNDRLPLPCLIKLATKQLRHFGGKPNWNCFRFHFNPERFEVFRLIQSILTNSKSTKVVSQSRDRLSYAKYATFLLSDGLLPEVMLFPPKSALTLQYL